MYLQAAQLIDRKWSYVFMVPKLCTEAPQGAAENSQKRIGMFLIFEGNTVTSILPCMSSLFEVAQC